MEKRLLAYIAGLISLVLVFPLVGCRTEKFGDKSIWGNLESEKNEVIKKMDEILNKANPEIVKEINEILDKDRFSTAGTASGFKSDIRAVLGKTEVRFLIEKSEISIPLMLKWLANKKGVKDPTLCAYFLIFGEVESVESIPFLMDYLISLPKSERRSVGFGIGYPSAYVLIAIKKIMRDEIISTYYGSDLLTSLFDQRFEIAKQAKEWYDNYKKTHE